MLSLKYLLGGSVRVVSGLRSAPTVTTIVVTLLITLLIATPITACHQKYHSLAFKSRPVAHKLWALRPIRLYFVRIESQKPMIWGYFLLILGYFGVWQLGPLS